MSLPIVISERAERDMALQYQWYLEHAGLEIAERYLLAVDEAVHALSSQPDLGIIRHFQSAELQNIRSSQAHGAFDKHLIFYSPPTSPRSTTASRAILRRCRRRRR
jgi:plasmid stabilization system protein ParE